VGEERRGIGNRQQSGQGATWGRAAADEPQGDASAQERTILYRGAAPLAQEEKTPPPGPVAEKPATLPARRPSQPQPPAGFDEKTPPPSPLRRPARPQPADASATGMSRLQLRLLALWRELVVLARRYWGLLRDRVLHPGRVRLTQTWQELTAKVRKRFEARTVEGDTFDRDRVDQWQKFHKGKTSSSYLTKVDD
jgi:hypothetical protein